jgi:hypothetical protein
MAKREKRHTNHNLYFASAILLLAFALQGFLPTAAVLSASEPLTEIPTAGADQRAAATGPTPTIAARSAAKQPSARAGV